MSSSLAVEVGGLVFSFYNARQAPTKIPLEQRAHLYTSSGQAPYRSFRRKRQNSFILLPLLSPQSYATLRGPHEVSCALPRACGRMEVLTRPHWRLAPHRENCIFPATACASTLLRPHETERLAAASCSVSWG